MLDTYDYKSFGWASALIGGFLLLGALYAAFLYFQRSSDPARSPFARNLAKYGPLESIVPQIDAEMASAHTEISRAANTVHITQNWLIIATPFRTYGLKLSALLWVYRLIVKKKMYFVIPAGTRHMLLAYDRIGQKVSTQLNQIKIEQIILLLRQVAPQAIYGYDKRLSKLWTAGKGTDRSAFTTEAGALIAGQTLPEALTRSQYRG